MSPPGSPGDGDRVALAGGVDRRRLFVLTGGDGVGKTTVLREVAKRRPEWEVGSYRPADWLPHRALPHLDWQLERHPRTVVHALEPASRAALLLTIMMSHWEVWLRPRLEAGRVVLMDSYFYRFYAKERVRRSSPEFFHRALEALPDAGTVFLADLPPRDAAERLERFDVYEVRESATIDDFVAFQLEVRAALEDLLARRSCRVENLDAAGPPGEVAGRLITRIEHRLADPRPAATLAMPEGRP